VDVNNFLSDAFNLLLHTLDLVLNGNDPSIHGVKLFLQSIVLGLQLLELLLADHLGHGLFERLPENTRGLNQPSIQFCFRGKGRQRMWLVEKKTFMRTKRDKDLDADQGTEQNKHVNQIMLFIMPLDKFFDRSHTINLLSVCAEGNFEIVLSALERREWNHVLGQAECCLPLGFERLERLLFFLFAGFALSAQLESRLQGSVLKGFNARCHLEQFVCRHYLERNEHTAQEAKGEGQSMNSHTMKPQNECFWGRKARTKSRLHTCEIQRVMLGTGDLNEHVVSPPQPQNEEGLLRSIHTQRMETFSNASDAVYLMRMRC
jgi:hypothetical protein